VAEAAPLHVQPIAKTEFFAPHVDVEIRRLTIARLRQLSDVAPAVIRR
jgi:hypothetical protein